MKETGYVYQHRPSAKFVHLYTTEYPHDGYTYMEYTAKLHSSMLLPSPEDARSMLLNAVDDNGSSYGRDNFYEFELREVKVILSLSV